MSANLLGEQIAKFRKAAGMTQEDLGRAVGISAQAVSRWECGGAPDVTLLPAVADTLGVTVDALFGREGGEKTDIKDALRRWMLTVPQEQRLDRLCRLVWAAAGPAAEFTGKMENAYELKEYENHYKTDVTADGETYSRMRRTRVTMMDGLILGVRANDLSYAVLFPEPEAGWEPFLEDNELYRRLFQVLARPRCLELLEYLHSKPARFDRNFTAGAVSRQTGFDIAETEELLDALAELNLLFKTELETEDGLSHSFCLVENEGLVPFLCFASWLTDGSGIACSLTCRTAPILRGEKWKESGTQ